MVWYGMVWYGNNKNIVSCFRLSLFINNRLESALIALIPEEPDGWEWETGVAVNSQFTGSLKNFRIHQAVRSTFTLSRISC